MSKDLKNKVHVGACREFCGSGGGGRRQEFLKGELEGSAERRPVAGAA